MMPTAPQGLSPEEVAASRQAHGVNRITPPRDRTARELFAEKFRDPIIRILLVAAGLSLVIGAVNGDFTESVGILCAIVLATCVGFWFEWDAQQRFRRLNRINDDLPVKVLRGGRMCSIPQHEVVVGDRVVVESGDTVPADGELTESLSLKVNESTLTGEPVCDKSADPAAADPDATYPTNRLLRGTTVVDGYGELIVTAVGDRSEAGRVAGQATMRTEEPTPLNRQLTRLSTLIGRAGIAVSALIFCLMLGKAIFADGLLAQPWMTIAGEVLRIFMLAVALIVMAVPEGLPMSITLSLALSMRKMLRTNNLVRKMHACETMGAVTVICTDKTGTLTCNRMHVEQLIRCDELPAARFGETIACNTTAHLDAAGGVLGNPTEGALLSWLHEQGMDYEALRRGGRIVDRLTFSTERKYMATLFESGCSLPAGKRICCIKGAPEIILAHCAPGPAVEAVRAELASMQRHAMRTLAFAWIESEAATCTEALAGGVWQLSGVAALADPVREEVPAAVRRSLEAGIAVKIVTGDTPATATEIARQIGLWDDAVDGDRNLLTGAEFAAMGDEELRERVAELKILARARPLDKQRLVQLLQQRGEVVAVTGDGTNDAPALNFAHVGLSMGSGSAAAKDASDITLIDDSFSSIATAVLWGRSLYRNIQRFILFQLTINVVAIVVCLVGALAGSDLPLTVVQILWVNIIMDTFAAMAMASLPPDPRVMEEKPRPRDEFIITPPMRRTLLACAVPMTAALLALLFAAPHRTAEAAGAAAEGVHAATVFFTTFVFLQFWNMFNARAFELRRPIFGDLRGCREFFLVLAAIAGGQWLIVQYGGEPFHTVPLPAAEWALIAGGTALLALGGALVRSIGRMRRRSSR